MMGWSRAHYPRYRFFDWVLQRAYQVQRWALTGRNRALYAYVERGLSGKEIR
jgi:hypothetical protein